MIFHFIRDACNYADYCQVLSYCLHCPSYFPAGELKIQISYVAHSGQHLFCVYGPC